ncbi:uncharacterized protein zgc:153292 [Sardina pilchardus]|uniref:uncharacterized protein zgc:153292 n=1 Tax=Sardina pilchardus TaxID=27697 RepID=UPI002E12B52B
MPSCSAYNCKNRSEKGLPGVSFHRFPIKDPKRLKEWTRRTRWKNWTPKSSSYLCSDHFERHFFVRSGHGYRLRDTALPTIFNFPDNVSKKIPDGRQRKIITLFPKTPESPSEPSSETHGQSYHLKDQRADKAQSSQLEKIDWSKLTWHPSTFHDDYCVPQSIQWAKDDGQNGDNVSLNDLWSQGLLFIPKRAIKIKGRWEWLGVEVIGPLSVTQRGHKFVLSVMDFYSRWVEAYPMRTCNGDEIAQNIYDLVSCIGYPYGFLSRISPRCLKEINSALHKLVRLETSFIHHHPQAGSLDQTTKALIDKTVFDLSKQHPDGWDVCLPASVYRLCCTVNPSTHQRPLSLLHSKAASPLVKKPRLLMVDGGEINKFTFVLVEPQAPLSGVQLQCVECRRWHRVTQPTDIQEYEDTRLKDEEHIFTCPGCRVRLKDTGRQTEEGASKEERGVISTRRTADLGEKRMGQEEGAQGGKEQRKCEETRGRESVEGGGGDGRGVGRGRGEERRVRESDDTRGQRTEKGAVENVSVRTRLQRQCGRGQAQLKERLVVKAVGGMVSDTHKQHQKNVRLELGKKRGRGRPRRTEVPIKTGALSQKGDEGGRTQEKEAIEPL